MKHRVPDFAGSLSLVVAMGALMAGSSNVDAQSINVSPAATAAARQQYNLDIDACNNAGSPAPQRESCVRQAGLRLDRLRGVPAVPEPEATADGRAIVMTPSTSSTTLLGSTTTTTEDGRATVVVPLPAATP